MARGQLQKAWLHNKRLRAKCRGNKIYVLLARALREFCIQAAKMGGYPALAQAGEEQREDGNADGICHR